jgi:hypothetical protein
MVDLEKLKLRDLLGHFTSKQLWAAGGALIGLAATSFAAGAWLMSQKHALDLGLEHSSCSQQLQAKDDSINRFASDLENAAKTHEIRASGLEKLVAEAKSIAYLLAEEREWLRIKAEFLEHHLRYELAMDSGGKEDLDRARSLFVGFVHRLWKAQEDNAVRVAMGSDTDTARSILPIVARPIIQKPTAMQQQVIKTITFPDNSYYAVPYDIASDVHKRE